MVAHRERGCETQFERAPLPPPPGRSPESWYFSVLPHFRTPGVSTLPQACPGPCRELSLADEMAVTPSSTAVQVCVAEGGGS